MSVRLLSLLNATGNALRANPALADGPQLETSRIVDYQKHLARMSLHLRGPGGLEPRGHIQLQQFSFADGRTCIKACLNWASVERQVNFDIFGSADTNWEAEANRLAEAWLDGMPADLGNASLAASA